MNTISFRGLVLSAALSLGVLAPSALAQTSGVIRACVSKGFLLTPKGAVRIVGANEACQSTETPLSWNQTGPVGPPGPSGAADVRVYAATRPLGAPSSGVAIQCAAQDAARPRAVGGGGGAADPYYDPLVSSAPLNAAGAIITAAVADKKPTGWFAETDHFDGAVNVFVICAP